MAANRQVTLIQRTTVALVRGGLPAHWKYSSWFASPGIIMRDPRIAEVIRTTLKSLPEQRWSPGVRSQALVDRIDSYAQVATGYTPRDRMRLYDRLNVMRDLAGDANAAWFVRWSKEDVVLWQTLS